MASLIKSAADRRNYHTFTLPNELEVVVIQGFLQHHHLHPHSEPPQEEEEEEEEQDGDDEDEDDDEDEEEADEDDVHNQQAAVALSIGVGSYAEPKLVDGLAHFLEHMLFMGTKKYPDENSFEAFLSSHAGSSNGSTDAETTFYTFEVAPSHLQPALDRFAQFFIHPLLRKDATDRELCAIQSEFDRARQSDSVHLQQLLCHTSRPDHPMHRFSWGNRHSLQTLPEQNDVNVYDHLSEFFKRYYSANLMKLVVFGQDDVHEMEKWVREAFSPIPNFSIVAPSFEHAGCPWENTPQNFGSLYRVIPVKDVQQLYLTWSIPSLMGHYRQKPDDYIAHLIGYEGKGSILSYLKEKGWALSIYAGVDWTDGHEYSTSGALFSVVVKLTEQGLEQWDAIVGLVFQYLRLISQEKIPTWIFEEMGTLAYMNFRFQQEDRPEELVEQLAGFMQDRFQINRSHLLQMECLDPVFQPELVENLLDNYLLPSRVRIDLVAQSLFKAYEHLEWSVEPWFETKYAPELLTAERLEAWKMQAIDDKLALPTPNPYIPTNFDLIDIQENQHFEPQLLHTSPMSKLYYHSDAIFKLPRANACFLIAIPTMLESAEAWVLSDVFVRLVRDALTEQIYDASLAELHYTLKLKESGIELAFAGFNEKMHVLMKQVMQVFCSGSEFRSDRYAVIVEQMHRDYKNANFKPSQKARYLRLLVLREASFTLDALLEAIEALSFSKYQDFLQHQLFRQVAVRALIHGNVSLAHAIELLECIEQPLAGLCAHILPEEDYPRNQVRRLPPKEIQTCSLASEHEDEVNSVVEHYFQIGKPSLMQFALTDLVEEIMAEPLFDHLRTKEQLGYEVSCSTRLTAGILGFTVRVQSSSYSTEYVQQRVVEFLKDFRHQILANLSPEEFQNHVQAQIQLKSEPDTNLHEATQRNWYEIEYRRYEFQMNQKLVDIMASLTLDQVVEFFDEWFCHNSSQLRVHIRANCLTEEAKEHQQQNPMTEPSLSSTSDIVDWMNELPSYPNLV